MTTELPKNYDPKSVEKEVYDRWTATGAFNAEPGGAGEKYCIVIPPPNVTAALHLGHALNNTLQDVLIRVRRMQGYNALWMPGTDHAGIATQTVVEKRILAEEGRKRTDFAREEFVRRIQAWKDQYEARILDQLQKMGCSCDWRRTRFTMDEVCAKAVRANFFKLFSDGLIYRGKRLVNWDPVTMTVLADDEVEHEEVQGHFYYLRYPLTAPVSIEGATIEHVVVATTRPETMLGDAAVAMNPADPRAKYLVGKKVRLPIVGREIPIIADNHVVLPNPESDDAKARLSTGFLKVTPAHDPDDYQIGLRHDLPQINVMAPDGTISEKFGWTDWAEVSKDNADLQTFTGMDRSEAREAIVEWFRTEGLLEKVIDYTHQVGHSYRSHVPIEPYLSDQWYVAVKKSIPGIEPAMAKERLRDDQVESRGDAVYIKGTDVPVDSLAGLALMPLLDGRLKFTPDRYASTYKSWLENLRDWPISRQLWWGHQIPIWGKQCEAKTNVFHELDQVLPDSLEDLLEAKTGQHSFLHIVDTETGELLRPTVTEFNHGLGRPITIYVAIKDFKVDGQDYDIATALERCGFKRDPDVLDTWFSSALWPFSTLGWPEKTPELATWYPGDVLCTAREIITLWVSRMVMMGQYCAGDIPFHDVFIHAMIQDGQGRKMSKSLGNGIDPLDIIDSHGADAMRFTLVSMTTQTQDVRMPVESMTLPDGRQCNTSPKFDLGRNFATKLWNASRFAMMNLEGMPAWGEALPAAAPRELADRWILSRLAQTIQAATAAIDAYSFNELADTIYHFMWDDFCDWYLEIAKGRINAGQAAPKAIVGHCLDTILRLLHPIMPFITEAIWAKLNELAPRRGTTHEQASALLIRAPWPKANAADIDTQAQADFDLLREIVRSIRNVRTQHSVPPGKKVDVIVEAPAQLAQTIQANIDLLKSQANLATFDLPAAGAASTPQDAAAVAVGGVKVHVMGIVDRTAELARLTKQRETLTRGIKGIEGKIANPGFLQKAPPELVEKEKARLAGLQADHAAVEKALESLKV